MGMYCCCGHKINRDNFSCECDWEGWISLDDWPSERKNKNIPISSPDKNGKYLVRFQDNSGDRYETIKLFSLTPNIQQLGYDHIFSTHWEQNTWDDYIIYAWKEIINELEKR